MSRKPAQRTLVLLLACFTIVATLGWLAFSPVSYDGPVAGITPQTPSSPSELVAALPSVAVVTPAPADTPAAGPHEEAPACSAGCSSHAHMVAAPSDPAAPIPQAAALSKRAWDYHFLESLATAAVGNPIRFELTDGVFAAGTIQHLEHVEGALIRVSGKLDAPEAGRFFFQKQSLPGKQGDLAGLVEFPSNKTAWRIEPSGPGGKSELVKRRLDEVMCMPFPPPSAELLAADALEGPPLDPSDVPDDYIPPHNEGIISLQSMPGAPGVLYIDYRGGYTPTWGGITYEKPNVTNAQIKDVWKRVAEDFMPFNINVTTDIRVYEAAAESSRIRCICTPTNTAYPGAGGVAYVNSWNWTGDTPCWSFYYTGKTAAECISHEVGHTLSLSHDGRTTPVENYYGGQGSGAVGWAPIMGVGYYQPVAQWSKGEYTSANNVEDDLARIVTNNNAVDYRPDDTGSTLVTARYLEVNPDSTVFAEGVIETTGDTDAFRFTTTGGAVSLNANPVGDWASLAIMATLVDSNGTVIATDNVQTQLNASISTTLSAGTYTFRVTGAGRNDPQVDGFSNYASLGYYSLSGSVTNGLPKTHFNIAENSANGTAVGTVTATNPSPTGYTITSGNSNGAFAINNSGALTVANVAALNYEVLAANTQLTVQYELFVNITYANPALNETSRRVVVQVLDVNEAPDITGGAATILDDSPIDTNVLKAAATDPDRYDYVTSYSITAGNTGNAFAINSATGQITVATDLGSIANSVYNLTVTATDNSTPALTASSVVQITVVGIVYTTTMDANPGWTLQGAWAYGVPIGTSGDPASGFTGSNVIGFNLNGAYANNLAETHATTPAFNCSNLSNVRLSFYQWLGVENGQYDKAYVRVSNDGSNWTNVFAHDTSGNATTQASAWSLKTYDISAVADGAATVYIRWTMGTTDSADTFAGWNIDDVVVDGAVGGGAGSVLAETGGSTAVTEGGATDSYSISLTTQPTANVTVTIAPNSQLSVSSTTLTFTPANWATPQPVTVTAVDDSLHELPYTGIITHSLSGADNRYNSIRIDSVLVNITDNDNAPPVVNAAPNQTVYLVGVWSPTNLSPIAWYDASDAATITHSSGAVSLWKNKSSNSYHMAQSTSANQPTTGTQTINGRNVIAFDGSNDSLKTSTNPFGASISNAMLMGVFNIGTIHTSSTLFSLTGSPDNRWQSHAPWSEGTVYFDCGGSGATNRINVASGWSANQNKILGFYGSTTDSTQQVWANGSLLVGDADGHTVTTVSGAAFGFDGSGTYDNAQFGEVVIINNTVSAADRQKLEGHLAHKWGLATSLPVGHPYQTQSPTNAVLVHLDGTVSDGDSDPLTATWSQVSGPTGVSVSFGDANAVDTTATFTVAGVYTLRLTVSDQGVTTSADVVITVNPSSAGFTVTYAGNNSTSGTVPVDTNSPYNAGSTVTVRGNTGTLVRAGYTFNNWNTAANGSGSNYAANATFTIAANTTLYAKWTPNTYTVTFNQQSGSGGSASVTATSGSTMPTATAPTRAGYTFGGYYTQASGGGTQYYNAAMTSSRSWDIASNTTLYAKWTGNNYTITFDSSGGSAVAPITQPTGTAVTTPAAPTKAGYTFTGWSPAIPSTMPASNTTCVAQWTINNYTITFDSVGGSAVTAVTQNFGTAVTAPATPTRTGYTFASWSPAVPATMPSSNTNCVAQWTGISYTITFDKQSGTGGDASVSATYGSAMPAATAPTRTGYTFAGYYANSDGTGTQYYTASMASAANWNLTSAANLYAKWLADANGTWLPTAAGPFNWGDSANWTSSTIASGIDRTASFAPNITADQVANLETPRTIGNITFTDSTTPSNNLTISGNNILTLSRSSGIPVIDITQTGRSLTINSIIAGINGLQKNGLGTLILSGNNTYTGTTLVSGGTLSIDGNARIGAETSGAALNLSGGTTLQATATFGLYKGTPGTNNRAVVLATGQNGFDVTASNTLTVAGVISGTGSLIKNGTGTLTLHAENAYSGGTTVNTGTLELSEAAGANNGTGGISGTLTINAGATVNATTPNALGWGGAKVNTLTINGGLFNNTAVGDQGWGLTVNLTGGELRSNGGTSSASAMQYFSAGGGWAVNSLASANPSTISGRIQLRESNASNLLTFTVADGAAATDLLVSAAITQSAAGYGIAKNGAGTMTLQSSNTYSGPTNVSAGTLVITGATQSTNAITVGASGSIGFVIGSPVTASSASATLGGTVLVTGTPTLPNSYTLLTAASISGTPVLSNPIRGYSLVIEGGNTLKLNFTGTPYDTWSSNNATTGTPNDDFDNDGVPNVIEFVLGGDKNTKDLSKLPSVATPAGSMTISFLRNRNSIDPKVSVKIEVSTDLSTWPDVFTVAADTASSTTGVTVTNNGNGTDTITLTLPQGAATKKFAHVKVDITP